MTRETQIMKRVALHYNTAIKKYGAENVLGVFLYGSQNYQCDNEGADVDTKCILVPDLYHLAIKPYETKHLHIPRDGEEYEVCECMTIMHMVSNWKKQNPNFLEIMFTHYCIVNNDYKDLWEDFINTYREDIARYDVRAGVMSIAHQAIHTIKQNPMDGKKIGNAYRLMLLLSAYDYGVNYGTCLVPLEDDQRLISTLKAGTQPVLEDYAENLISAFEFYIGLYDEKKIEPNKYVEAALETFILQTLHARLLID